MPAEGTHRCLPNGDFGIIPSGYHTLSFWMQLVKQRLWFWDWIRLRASRLAAGTVLTSLAPICATIQEAGYGLGRGQGAIMKRLFVLPLAAFCTVAGARAEPIIILISFHNMNSAQAACSYYIRAAQRGSVDAETQAAVTDCYPVRED